MGQPRLNPAIFTPLTGQYSAKIQTLTEEQRTVESGSKNSKVTFQLSSEEPGSDQNNLTNGTNALQELCLASNRKEPSHKAPPREGDHIEIANKNLLAELFADQSAELEKSFKNNYKY